MIFFWPLKKVHITQSYGNKSKAYAQGYHMGIDLRAAHRTPVYAAQDGTVAVAKALPPYDGYGCHVALAHAEKYFTIYGHLDEIIVHKGEKVVTGQLIGFSGGNATDYGCKPGKNKLNGKYTKAGFSTAYHLHFEIDKNIISPTNCVDPTKITSYNDKFMDTDPNMIPDWAKSSVEKAHKKGLQLPSPNTAPTKYECAVYFDKMGLLDKLPDVG